MYPTMEFHISKESRDRYDFDQALYQTTGNVVFPHFHAVRSFVRKMNEKKDLVRYPEQAVQAGEINGIGLIDEIFHYMLHRYREEVDPAAMRDALEAVETDPGPKETHRTLMVFIEQFPPLSVYRGEQTAEEYLEGEDNGVANREIVLEEMLVLFLANENPAFKKYDELFNDSKLRDTTPYRTVMDKLEDIFKEKPGYGPNGESLIEMLLSPARLYPDSLTDQLGYIRERWGPLLGHYFMRLLRSLDYIREEEKTRLPGPGPAEVYDFTGFDEEYEGFTPDKEWMPHVVLIAKTAFVWLDQLSKAYNRQIEHLDDIPDEEIDTLARRGFTAVWLIGLWERSRASKRIKQICGNPEAEASAYSVIHYDIAYTLGGWNAFLNLKERCGRRGIRLMGDMVPNHTGIDSEWVIDHPDWFIQSPHSPYPSYTYSGVNLSDNHRVGIFIEDHYFDRTDAAVTFKWIDFYNGETRYVYHGNDGTSMPWNDTAQLNFLNPEVREAVIQTILHVARNFPIIRFDAAMTLAKRHFQRLWFPEPGSGGDIPSRAEFGLTKEEFNKAIPKEFWREVVDRIAVEAPDTLLLAEAFWMMEGYFVRSLGMHRVYNSAFMNMLKAEENGKYRETIKNTVEYDPGILNRFVNFLNNPDEDTALAQFGTGDKYFGVCAMMVTMPGLPMFGHGQIEGFAEKYGMEYRKAYRDEKPDESLVHRHETEIFPLMKRRALFSGAENFRLYDVLQEGGINENVFAYSNKNGIDLGLVLFNNKYEQAYGTIYRSAPYSVKEADGQKRTATTTVAEALDLRYGDTIYTVFREHRSGLLYIRNNRELHEQGLNISLQGFEYQVFLDFFEVQDSEEGYYGKLAQTLGGAGFTNLETALKEVFLDPLHNAFMHAYPTQLNSDLIEAFLKTYTPPEQPEVDRLCDRYRDFVRMTEEYLSTEGEGNGHGPESTNTNRIGQDQDRSGGKAVLSPQQSRREVAVSRYRKEIALLIELPSLLYDIPYPEDLYDFAVSYLKHGFQIMPETVHVLCSKAFITPLSALRSGGPMGPSEHAVSGTNEERNLSEGSTVFSNGEREKPSKDRDAGRPDEQCDREQREPDNETESIMEELWFERPLRKVWKELGEQEDGMARDIDALKMLTTDLKWNKTGKTPKEWAGETMKQLLLNNEVRQFLGINRYEEILYFNKEAFHELVWWLFLAELSGLIREGLTVRNADEMKQRVSEAFTCVRYWVEALEGSSYRVARLLSLLGPEESGRQSEEEEGLPSA